jgi:glycosyltransferase involved in cell wall biosynthesis
LNTNGATPDRPTAAIIPVFNEQRTIADIVRRTARQVERIIVVDDGSTDGSCEAAGGSGVAILRQPENRGKGAALLRGIEYARNAGAVFVITLDADGQHPPECIPDLLRHADPDHIVIGSRVAGAQAIPTARLWANRTANFFISWAAGHWIEDTQCGFRIYPLRLFDGIRLRANRRSGFVFESEILIEACRNGFQVTPVAVPALYASVLQRPSHFRPVFDVSAIIIMVAGKLLARALCLPGLIRSQRERRRHRLNRPCIQTRDAAL